MFKIIVFACLLSLAAAKPSPDPALLLEAPIPYTAAYAVPEVVGYTAPLAYSSAYQYSAYSPYAAYTYAAPYNYYFR